jgi:hypothetical protein
MARFCFREGEIEEEGGFEGMTSFTGAVVWPSIAGLERYEGTGAVVGMISFMGIVVV